MAELNKVYLLLGSNIEPRYEYIKKAEKEITDKIGNITIKSEIYESEPLGFSAETSFLNCVIFVNSILSASDIINKIHKIEHGLGRKRNSYGYSSRTMDIDILYFNYENINTTILQIPHPRLHERRFTLLPLMEIAPDYTHPVLNMSNKELLALCSDKSSVTIYNCR